MVSRILRKKCGFMDSEDKISRTRETEGRTERNEVSRKHLSFRPCAEQAHFLSLCLLVLQMMEEVGKAAASLSACTFKM